MMDVDIQGMSDYKTVPKEAYFSPYSFNGG